MDKQIFNINIDSLKNKFITIIGHKHADFDTMTSGYLLQYIFSKLDIRSKYVLQDREVDPYFEEMAHKLGFEYELFIGVKENDKLFLVDHTDAYSQEVLGCFDHHPEIIKIDKNYINTPKTSCAKLIYEWAEELGIDISKSLTILTVYSCYMDSLSFKSTKALPEDKEWCQEQIKKYDLNEKEIIEFCYGLTPKTPYLNYLKNGLKSYAFGDKKINTTYVVTTDDDDYLETLAHFFRSLLTDEVIAWCFIVSNVEKDHTRLLFVTQEYTLIQTVNKLLSRGKNIIPAIMTLLSSNNDGTVTKMLIDKKLEIATMESCTSGLIASNITDYEGSSSVLKGSSITYSNAAKIMAGVDSDVINTYGVYSPETAIEMAKSTKKTFSSDIGIGITGSFGNVDPANPDSVAGNIDYQILYNGNETPIKLIYSNIDISRKEIKQKTVDIVLATLHAYLEQIS